MRLWHSVRDSIRGSCGRSFRKGGEGNKLVSQDKTLSVIIPAYNRPDDVAALLASLEPDLGRVEVIVVDDASPDPAVYAESARRWPVVRFVRQARNQGPAAARNRGAREASCGLLFFVDSDTVIVPGTMPSSNLPGENFGPSLYCAVIVKTVDAQTRSKTSINELLRD